MALTAADIKVYKAANNSDTSSNGGAITTNEVVDVVGALFPNVDNAERLSGSTKWRKMFFKVVSNNNTALIAARVYQDVDTQGEDIILMVKGTNTDTQSSILTNNKLYASVNLDTSVVAGSNTIAVNIPSFTNNWFEMGNTIRISDKLATDSVGNEEFLLITGVAINGSVVTLTLSDVLVNSYVASVTRVMNVIELGDVVASANNLVKTSSAGLFNISKVSCTNLSTVDASWTLTFTNSTTFNITSSLLGSAVVGNNVTNASVINPITSLPYFSIDSSAFSGTFVSGDIISFNTVAAIIPIWLKRIIPVGAAPVAINKSFFILDGGSV